MLAVRLHRFGGPEVLAVEEAEPPVPGPGEIVILVGAASINPFDRKVRTGMFAAGSEPVEPVIIGVDAAGVIAAVGPDVTGWSAGDPVFGIGRSTYAEQAVLHAWARKPDGIDDATAAAAATTGEAALRSFDLLGLDPDARLLIDGGAGGVGTVAIQLARRRGYRVVATGSAANQDYLRSLGAEPVEYGAGLADRVRALWPDGPDAVFDVAGKTIMDVLIGLAGEPRRVVSIANFGAADTGVQVTGGGGDPVAALAEVADALAAGDLRIPVRTYPFADVVTAHRDSEAGGLRGKLALVLEHRA
ncbi:NADP-dependent oxidoreductase [Microlunatus parietis]|uniref:NADPH:quinone reductase-like Zn-dependent oxidoreductase n=1 Tax=Microlunatus parietis TaxID=682979 RepID=A0A7Y9IEF1_9ACTN|nr:NADP-dependent oxidoreductase [Microlunatus parietis]NYE75096.1 NADPH:quinone reductase-like Zn-dependent oxidoreductase [Microlunatus parietis]